MHKTIIMALFLVVPGFSWAQPVRSVKKAQKNLISFSSPWTSPFKVDNNHPHHLMNREGEHLLILNKTAWAYFASADPRGVLERARDQGVNVIRVTLEGTPYFDHLKMDMWPWGGTRQNPDYSRFNEAYWDEVERRVRLAGEYGIGINLTLYFSLTRQVDKLPHQQAFWAYTLKRLGNYANILTWEIINEYLGHEAFQDEAGRFFAQNDPWQRPVITSDGTTDDAAWPQKDWMGMAIVHTCTGSTDNHPLYGWYLAVARNTRSHGKPAFNNESGREIRHRNDDPIHRRKQAWIWYAAGCHWTWHSWEGCEGIDDANYRGPGQEFMKPVTTFFRSLPFWKMEPNFTVVQVSSPDMFAVNLAEPSRQTNISYLCTHRTGKHISGETATVRLPNGLYKISFIDPATLENLGSVDIQSTSLGRLYDLPLPAFTDDLAIKIDRVQVAERTVIKGTE
jgi:hypothetical protein